MTRTVPSQKRKSGKKSPVERTSRGTFVRWIRILDSLRADAPPAGYQGTAYDWKPNAMQFGKAFGCHWRTIQRDLDGLRACGYDIEYDRSEHRLNWLNKRGVETLPLMAATEDEFISLMTSLAISSSVLDAATAKNLRTFLNKLEQHMEGPRLYPFETVKRIIHYKHVHASCEDTALWTRLERAILDQKGIRLEYSSPYEGNRPYPLKLLPLLLANLEGIWYLYAMKAPVTTKDSGAAYRIYRLNRMSKVKPARIQVPEEWDREGVLKKIEKGIGAWQGGEVEKVCLRIAADKIGFMKERAWNPGHRFTRQRDGSWLLRFKASNVEHLLPFVLQWGPDVEVVEPEYLRDDVAWTARRVAEMHAPD